MSMWPPLVCRIGGLVNGAEAPTSCAGCVAPTSCAGCVGCVWDRLFCYCIFQGLRARASRVAGSRLFSMCRSSSVSTTNLARHSDDTMDSMVWI